MPLVSRTETGSFRAHDLWTEALLRVLPRDEVADLRGRVLEELVTSGDLARAGILAMAHEDVDALAKIAMEVVRRSIAALPIDLVQPWADVLRRSRPRDPETHLLDAALHQALDFTDRRADIDADLAATGFRDRGDPDGEIAAVVVATLGSYMRGDVVRLVELAQRVDTIPGSREHPTIDVALRSIAAIGAEMRGDLATALEQLRDAPLDQVPVSIRSSVSRLYVHCLLLSGRAEEAVGLTSRLLAVRSDRATRYLWAIARWMSGEPNDLLGLNRTSVDFPAVTSRDEYVRRTVVAAMLASTGRRDDVHRLVEGTPSSYEPIDARDAVLEAVALALCAVVDHDEAPAARVIAATVAAHADSPILDQHLRRLLALCYVLDEDIRRRWDGAAMGPTHERIRAAARCLVALRTGRRPDTAGLDPARVFTAFPLPWSVELAVRLHGARRPEGARLAEWLVDQVPEPARVELRHLSLGSDAVARAAVDLLGHLPAVPARPLEISVLGPLTVAFDGVAASAPELRRTRVRALLSLLVIHGTLTRDLVTELLWPDHSAAAGARNLRVTLTYLRQLLEPERPSGEASFHLRADAERHHAAPVRPPRRRLVGAPAPAPRRRAQSGAGRSRPHHRHAGRRHGVVAGRAAHRSGLRRRPGPRGRAGPAAPAGLPARAQRAAPRARPGGQRPGQRRAGPRPRPLLGTSPPPGHRRRPSHPRPGAGRERDRASPRHARRARRRARTGHADPAPSRHRCPTSETIR